MLCGIYVNQLVLRPLLHDQFRVPIYEPLVKIQIVLSHAPRGKSLLETLAASGGIRATAAAASSLLRTRKPLIPSSMISGTEPRG